jgi:hypothetical protein
MLPGRYLLNCETLGIDGGDQQRKMVMIPEGSRITVAEAKVGSRLITVLWEGRRVLIFAEDLDERGIREESQASNKTRPKM